MQAGTRFGTRLGHVCLFVALATLPVLALNSFATADTGAAADHGSRWRPDLTDAQRECLTEHGVTLPSRDAEPRDFTRDQRKALHEAAAACGLKGRRPRVALRQLTDDERACLAEHDAMLPGRPRGPQARAAFRDAAAACGLPIRGGSAGHGTI